MKIAVYAIARDEEPFARRWAECAQEADYRVVLDTGSVDATVAILEEAGVSVHRATVLPWRFDVARNLSLELVPPDAEICIALDLDEVLQPGWRAALEAAWKPTTTMLRYPFVAAWRADGASPLHETYGHRIHSRHGYRWRFAVHELPSPSGRHEETRSETLRIHHYPLPERKDPDRYLRLLEEWVNREPGESRYSFYLARDLYNRGRHREALAEFQRFLQLSCSGEAERSFALRLMSRSLSWLEGPSDRTLQMLYSASTLSPKDREAWLELAIAMIQCGNWPNALAAAVNAIQAKDPFYSYQIEPTAWSGEAERILELVCQRLGISFEMTLPPGSI